MKPSHAFLLRGVVAVTVLTLLAAFSTHALFKREIAHVQLEKIQRAGSIAQALQESDVEQLDLRARMLASDRDFVEYVVQSLTPNPQRGGAIDKLSITDLLNERRQGYDVAMILDTQGHLVSQSGLFARNGDSIAHDVLVAEVLKSATAAHGAWLQDGALYWVVISPLMQDNALKGLLVTASQVTRSFAQQVNTLSGSDIALLTPSSIVAVAGGGVDVNVQSLLTAQTADIMAVAGHGGGTLDIRDSQRPLQTWVAPIHVAGLDLAMVAVNTADDPANGQGSLLPIVGVVLFGVIMATLVLTQWWRTWRPLDQILDVLERAAKGDRTLVLRTQGSAIVRRIGDSFNDILKFNRP
jgi:hypothetical protein